MGRISGGFLFEILYTIPPFFPKKGELDVKVKILQTELQLMKYFYTKQPVPDCLSIWHRNSIFQGMVEKYKFAISTTTKKSSAILCYFHERVLY